MHQQISFWQNAQSNTNIILEKSGLCTSLAIRQLAFNTSKECERLLFRPRGMPMITTLEVFFPKLEDRQFFFTVTKRCEIFRTNIELFMKLEMRTTMTMRASTIKTYFHHVERFEEYDQVQAKITLFALKRFSIYSSTQNMFSFDFLSTKYYFSYLL